MTDEDRPGHTHRLPRAVLLTLVIICGGLVISLVLVSALARQAQQQADETNRRLEALEGFVADRGEVRDQQYRTLDERITAAICDLLDHLPAGPILDPLRADYGCGPGLPVEALSPEAQQQLQRYGNDAAGPQSVTKPGQPSVSSPETTDAPSPTPTVAPPPVARVQPAAPTPGLPPVAPAAPTTPPPLVDLTPITDPLCTGLGLCL